MYTVDVIEYKDIKRVTREERGTIIVHLEDREVEFDWGEIIMAYEYEVQEIFLNSVEGYSSTHFMYLDRDGITTLADWLAEDSPLLEL